MRILRIVLGVIGAYIVMAILIVAWAFGASTLIWPELAPANGKPTIPPADHAAWFAEVLVNLLAAFAGGLALCAIAGQGRRRAAQVLVALVLLAGFANLFLMPGKPLWAGIAAPLAAVAGISAAVAWRRRR